MSILPVMVLCLFLELGMFLYFFPKGMPGWSPSGKRKVRRLLEGIKGRLFNGSRRRKKRQLQMENEIYQSLILLKNMALLQKNAPKGGIYILEQLIPYTKLLSQPLQMMLHYMRLNRPEQALDAFCRLGDTKSAERFGRLLIRMDEIPPGDLQQTLELYRSNLREEALTREKQKNELQSDLVYIPVMGNVMLIFINFIYVAYYAQQRDMFQQLFM